MAVAAELVGQRFGRLTVAARTTSSLVGKAMWVCRCDCGGEKVTNTHHLRSGNTTSCGCVQRERASEANRVRIRHGHTRDNGKGGRATSPEYRSWKAMLERCRNPNAPNYHLYGGRGITVCDRWLGRDGFVNFLADMGARPKGTSLDRINTDGDYEPGNCRWADAKTQSTNRRDTPELAKARKVNLAKGRRYWPKKGAR